MVRVSEDAINILIAAQRECEEMYLASPEPELKIVSLTDEEDETEK